MINIYAVCAVCNSNIPLFDIDTRNEIRIKNKISCCGVEVFIVGAQEPKTDVGHFNENIVTVKARKIQCFGNIESRNTAPSGKVLYTTKKGKKTYSVSVSYIELKDEEARIKRLILESILKKSKVV